ncbi:NAD(+) diphosphatase [Parabacteroides sp. PF5-9]|uniref:NAD(+) diphosphatase n=1 Tax=Parabacteroides sp. PF5-9 TaxID=1742404 RepID=UPI002476A70E|nr:NAD(+) diphosphatase [Parabacteroides sp. PF5-9]
MHREKHFCWFIFDNDQLLIEHRDGQYMVPESLNPPVPLSFKLDVSSPEKENCVVAIPEPGVEINNSRYFFTSLREAWGFLDSGLYKIAGRAAQILYWEMHSRFCPVCGIPTQQTTPITKVCPSCHFEQYPVISTAILALVRKGDQILLVQARNFKGTFHGLVAGFLEAGETLEECVAREVREETGLTVNNITYFANQPWPFPSGLMVGFIADYVEGELVLQEEELKSAAFFDRAHLPELPRKLSLARKMIDWWLESNPSS